ncbi:MAG: RNA methyltransferase [Bacteroidaceae bacterium]|nr:RNA methyltransferase [Bacteroidaceae bacterium]MBP5731739.1 RNA methyltransferase [Bacteroidaceae bacterium]
MNTYKMVAKTMQGLEEVLAQELTALGAADVQAGRRVVTFSGDLAMMYKANFCLRTALRILKPIKEFKAYDADDVYRAVHEIDWNQYLSLKTSFSVDSVVYSEEFKHSKFVAYKVKDAIVDFFREQTGQRPNISITNPDIRLNIHINDTDCTLSLDSSGESLHKRGYRVATVDSPINEVLAAGMLMMTGWHGECDLIDPMCGSGTIAIEAALLARNIWPGVFHTHKYAFENWPDYDAELLQQIYNDDTSERPFEHKIYARDIEPAAVNATMANARSASVADCMDIAVQPFQQFTKPEQPTIMVMNPPYGERISSPNLLGLYKTIGEKLKHQFCGNDAWIISYRQEAFESIGLKPSLKIPLFNGALECEFRKYQIFDGKYRAFRNEGGEIKTDEERRRMRNRFPRTPYPRQRDNERRDDSSSEDDDIPAYLRERHRKFVAKQRQQEEKARSGYPGPGRDKRPPKGHSRSPWAKKFEK